MTREALEEHLPWETLAHRVSVNYRTNNKSLYFLTAISKCTFQKFFTAFVKTLYLTATDTIPFRSVFSIV